MTGEQRERLLGQILLGLSTETAAANLGLTITQIAETEDADPAFRSGLFAARQMRDSLERVMEDIQPQ
jgi:hypothetical protein